MTTKKGKKTSAPAMGHDPLAWIAEGSMEEPEASTASAVKEEVREEAQADQVLEVADLEKPCVEKTIEETVAVEDTPLEDVSVNHTKEDESKGNEATVILLDDDMIIQHIETLHHAWADRLLGHSAIILDGAELQQIDTSGVQMLSVFVRDVATMDVSLAWRNVPDCLLENATLLGLHDQMLFSNNVDL